MTTKAFRRDIASLGEPKGRRKLGAFMAEGTKCVLDTISHFSIRYLIATPSWLRDHNTDYCTKEKIIEANRGEIGEMSSMTLAPDVIAVYDLPSADFIDLRNVKGQLILALDRVQDPGNLGTIIRTADWMGVSTILASHDTVDCFNPKVVQATMGAISRVRVIYVDLAETLSDLSPEMPIYGTFLDGENIYAADLSSFGIIIMGNEGRGISDEISSKITRRLLIPSYPPERPTSESLNVATASAIVLSQFRSRHMK